MRFFWNSEGEGGGDPPAPAPAPPAQPPTPPPADPPKSKAETNWEQADRQARFWAQATPEDRQRYIEMIESNRKDGESPETRALREEVQQIKTDREVERALRVHGLDDEFEDILRKLPLDDIMPMAERLSSKLSSKPSGGETGKPEGEPRKPREYKPAETAVSDPDKIAKELAKSGWMG